MLFINLALKNILTHRNRSIVTILLVSGSTTLLIFTSAMLAGSHSTLLKNSVEIYPGYIQLTQQQYRQQPSPDTLIFDIETIRQIINDVPGIAATAARFESGVLYVHEDKAVGGMFTGIEPDKEKHISRLQSSLRRGTFLRPMDKGLLYIGQELAHRLNVDVGDTLAFVGTGADSSFAADTLQVKGIFQTGLFDFDSSAAFVSKNYFDHVMTAANMASHLIILPTQPAQSEEVAAAINTRLRGSEYHAAPWQENMVGLVQAMEVDSIFGYISLAIIFMVILFVVMIYTLLSIFGRLREIGIMRALGTSPQQIFFLLSMESCLLALTSILIGGLLGGMLSYYFQVHPIVFSGYEEQFKQYGLALSAMPTSFSLLAIGRDMAIIFILAMLSTLYPIMKVNTLQPKEAMDHV